MPDIAFMEDLILDTAQMVRPPERLAVSEAAEKYRKLNIPGGYVGPWKNEVTPYLIDPMNVLTSRDYTGMCFAGPAQTGKLLDLDTTIPTPDGWARFGDLRVGDVIFGLDGKQTKIVVVNEIKQETEAYAITFDDGQVLIADATHDWCVNDMWSKEVLRLEKRTTKWLFDRYKVPTKTGHRYRFAIPVAKPLEAPEGKLPIEPYLFGVWLGDGGRHSGSLTLGNQDCDEIVSHISNARVAGAGNSADTAKRVVVEQLKAELNRMGQGPGVDKFIPHLYLRASIEQRVSLLQGLMDTDGSVDKRGRFEFSSSYECLANTAYELMVSLGLKVHRDNKIPKHQNGDGKRSFRLSFVTENASLIFRLSRQIEKHKNRNRTSRPTHSSRRFIRSMERVVSRPMRCIGVDASDHLYLAGRGMIATHNTDMVLNWVAHSAICDPADMMIIEKSQATARDFSMRRLDRLYRHSPEVGARLIPGRQNQNTYDSKFKAGQILTLSWPTINELSGKPIPRLWLTDYDRMPEDIDGEGAPFDLASKRTTTFKSFGMTAVESSPGYEIENPKWMAGSPHEAPPTKGILSIYNRGDRRRWYWKCVSCKLPFEGDFHLIQYPDSKDHMEAAEQAFLPCPHCGQIYYHDSVKGIPGKHELNHEHSKWIKDGCKWLENGAVVGTPYRSNIASFWLKGVAASFTDWKGLVLKYLQAMDVYERTGDQDPLKTTINVDQGLPFSPIGVGSNRLPEDLKNRAEDLAEKEVPNGVRFLIATIDVQKNRFVVQIHGLGVNNDVWVIDRYDIRKSDRKDDDGERYWISPGSYLEDWYFITTEVMKKTYPLSDGSNRHMSVRMTFCDSGGKEGVTAKAYDYWRHLRDKQGENLHRRFLLVKGASVKTAPRVAVSFPDSDRKDRKAAARGEVPVLMINSDIIKDQVDKMLDREIAEGGKVSFPDWLPDSFYTELTAENRTPKGWENPKKLRNESWDLLCYAVAGALCQYIGIERIDWTKPPSWAAEWDKNDLVSTDAKGRFTAPQTQSYDFTKLGQDLM